MAATEDSLKDRARDLIARHYQGEWRSMIELAAKEIFLQFGDLYEAEAIIEAAGLSMTDEV